MRQQLDAIRAKLPELLAKAEIWKSLLIDYRNPVVERLYTDVDDLRVSLHCIQPCTKEEAFYHPHPWPSAILLVEGRYEMGVAYGAGTQTPPTAMTLELSGGDAYEMINPDGWHYVRPLEKPSYSLMVNGKKWERVMPDFPAEPLKALSVERASELLAEFAAKLKAL